MNCEDMIKIPELKNVFNLKAGFNGIKNAIRWIYFADCLQCVKNEYHVEDYIHGGEFVVLTNRDVTENKDRIMGLVSDMVKHGIAALGINEGQILPELAAYCDKENLPLFELPEKFPLVDLSQILCKRLVLEENNRNLEEQVFASILDAEHLNRDSVLEQAEFLNIDLSLTIVAYCLILADVGTEDNNSLVNSMLYTSAGTSVSFNLSCSVTISIGLPSLFISTIV